MGQEAAKATDQLPCGHAKPEGTVTIKPGDSPGVDAAVAKLFAFGQKIESMDGPPPMAAMLALMKEKNDIWVEIKSEAKAAGLLKSDQDYDLHMNRETRAFIATPAGEEEDGVLEAITRMMAEGNGQQPVFH